MPRPSLVTSSGPSPVRGFIAAMPHPLPQHTLIERIQPGSDRDPAGPQQPCRSVALLSRVRTQNGNDQPCAPSTKPVQSPYRQLGTVPLRLQTPLSPPVARGLTARRHAYALLAKGQGGENRTRRRAEPSARSSTGVPTPLRLSKLSDLGGAGDRTLVLRDISRSSPSAVCFAFLSPGDHADKTPTGSVTVWFPSRSRDRTGQLSLLATPGPGSKAIPG